MDGYFLMIRKCQIVRNILDPLEIIDKYGIDQLRYYLVKEVSLGNDGSISMENLKNVLIMIWLTIMEIYVKVFIY